MHPGNFFAYEANRISTFSFMSTEGRKERKKKENSLKTKIEKKRRGK